MECKWYMVVLLLAIHVTVVFCESDMPQKECSSGGVCFPNGRTPHELTPRHRENYCCPDRNWRRPMGIEENATSADCTCVLDMEMDSKMQQWTERTKDAGRMCNREEDCGGLPNTTVNYKFNYCCRQNWHNTDNIWADSYVLDGDNDEFIGCRCMNHPVPSRDPKAYVAPQHSVYKSSGEDCSHDKGCDDRPSLKCSTETATFCCYGSRGIVTVNHGDKATNCTCTNDIFGKQCEPRPVPIADSFMPCSAECSSRTDEDVCTDASSKVFCCPTGMVVTPIQSKGYFTSCKCKVGTKKACSVIPSTALHQVLSQGVVLFALVFALSFGHLDVFG